MTEGLPLENYIGILLECAASRHFGKAQTLKVQKILGVKPDDDLRLPHGMSIEDRVQMENEAGLEALKRLTEFRAHMEEFRRLREEAEGFLRKS